MTEYEVETWEVNEVEGDDQVELVITSTDGNRWEYGIPFSRGSGRYTFVESDVIAMDFGEELAEEVTITLDALIAKLA